MQKKGCWNCERSKVSTCCQQLDWTYIEWTNRDAQQLDGQDHIASSRKEKKLVPSHRHEEGGRGKGVLELLLDNRAVANSGSAAKHSRHTSDARDQLYFDID